MNDPKSLLILDEAVGHEPTPRVAGRGLQGQLEQEIRKISALLAS